MASPRLRLPQRRSQENPCCPSATKFATPRLSLIAITPVMLHAEQAADGSLARLIDCTLPPNWPPVDWEPHVLDTLLTQFDRYPHHTAWHRYIALSAPDGTRTLIGCLGAFWREIAPAECEIGYTILPPHEGLGLATEGTRALIDLLRHDPHQRITAVIAHTFPQLAASLRVMEKCGLTPDGPGTDPTTLRYRLLL